MVYGRETKPYRDLRAVSLIAGVGKQQMLNQEGSTWRWLIPVGEGSREEE